MTTMVTPVGRSALGTDLLRTYEVEVRTSGGVARAASLRLIAQRPLVWAVHPAGCVSGRAGHRLRCSLGDVARSERLLVGVRYPAATRSRRVPRIVAVAGAANVTREATLAVKVPSGSVTRRPDRGKPPAAPDPSKAPGRKGGPGPSGSPGATAETGSGTAGASASTRPGQGSNRKAPNRKVPKMKLPSLKPARPPSQHRPERPPAAPLNPVVPAPQLPAPQFPVPQAPPLPAMPAPSGAAERVPQMGTAPRPGVLPMPSPSVLPSLPAPAPAQTAGRAADAAQLTMISPSGSEEREGTSWTVVLGMVLVGEVALLWLVACLSVLRRRIVVRRQGAHRRV
ncbi:hypothetical protein GCM10010411_50420 [Actinomadura fulvescens]|uniref:Uncharacterized protein n=2 Tax=Actinomadura fulvescens TaxID=46160 RepID=A0ABP6CD09_9ACTN